MATINSVAVGEGRNSVGEFTYRYVNGETIASKRVFKNNSKTHAQVLLRHSFAEMQALRREISPIIQAGYCKSGKLTAVNYFSKVNRPYFNYCREHCTLEVHDTPILNLYDALNDTRFVNSRVFAAYGGKELVCDVAWDKDQLPVVTLNNPYEFIPGDVVTIAFALSYKASRIRYERTRLFSKTLTKADIDQLSVNTSFTANNQTMPGLNPLTNIHADAAEIKVIAAAILHTTNVTADTGNATSLFLNMPPLPVTYQADKQDLANDHIMHILSNTSETFPTTLAQYAVGAVLDFQVPSPASPQTYNVTAIALDDQQRPVGLILTDPHGYDIAPERFGEQATSVPLTKDGQLLAHIEGLRIPKRMP